MKSNSTEDRVQEVIQGKRTQQKDLEKALHEHA